MGTEKAAANGIELAYETFGRRDDPPVLLIAGVGAQMISWPDGFCELLAERELRPVRFDNRDVGESTHLHEAGAPDLKACLAGDTSSAPYELVDMARDTVGLLDALAIDTAHVVGLSMGGMIAQTLAAHHPERMRSLTSIMSTTGERSVSQPTPEALAVLMQPPARTREESIERALANARVLGSPGFPKDDDLIADRAARGWDRGVDPPGFARQMGAIYRSGNRTAMLRAVTLPTLVLHGEDDPLIPVEGGRATAAAVAGAELRTIPGMGHDLPRAVWPVLVDAIAGFVERVEREPVPAG
ncbi:MAG TPA: alpha/beta hydrolase [Thermoleophilaceae bacterium]|jgi:pimeloyl-ACP methyl ester carboxylesterase